MRWGPATAGANRVVPASREPGVLSTATVPGGVAAQRGPEHAGGGERVVKRDRLPRRQPRVRHAPDGLQRRHVQPPAELVGSHRCTAGSRPCRSSRSASPAPRPTRTPAATARTRSPPRAGRCGSWSRRPARAGRTRRPCRRTPRSRLGISGSSANSRAMFVSGPVASSMTGCGVPRIALRRKWTAVGSSPASGARARSASRKGVEVGGLWLPDAAGQRGGGAAVDRARRRAPPPGRSRRRRRHAARRGR